MNRLILNTDGTITGVGDAGNVPDLLGDGEEITREERKVHPGWLPTARLNALHRIRRLRDRKLRERDTEASHAATGRPGQRRGQDIEADRVKLRDLPPIAEAHLATLNNTDDMDAYIPVELQ